MIRATMAFLGCILVCCIPPRMPFYPPQKRAGDLTSSATVASAGSSLAVLRFSCLPSLGRESVVGCVGAFPAAGMIHATMAFLGLFLVCCIPPRMPFSPPQKRAGDLTSSAIVAGAGEQLGCTPVFLPPGLGEEIGGWVRWWFSGDCWIWGVERLGCRRNPLKNATRHLVLLYPAPWTPSGRLPCG